MNDAVLYDTDMFPCNLQRDSVGKVVSSCCLLPRMTCPEPPPHALASLSPYHLHLQHPSLCFPPSASSPIRQRLHRSSKQSISVSINQTPSSFVDNQSIPLELQRQRQQRLHHPRSSGPSPQFASSHLNANPLPIVRPSPCSYRYTLDADQIHTPRHTRTHAHAHTKAHPRAHPELVRTRTRTCNTHKPAYHACPRWLA